MRAAWLTAIPVFFLTAACGGGDAGSSPPSTTSPDGGTSPAPGTSTTPPGGETKPPTGCTGPTPTSIAFRILDLGNGLKAAAWYPTPDAEKTYAYDANTSSHVAENGALACGRRPLLVFSHGLGGCGTQSLFVTESLARRGFVVVAPDHRDADLCHVDNRPSSRPASDGPSVLDPGSYTDQSYADRRDDVKAVMDQLTSTNVLAPAVDPGKIGLVGHSLGGYTALGLAGAWPSWKDPRVKVVLTYSPFVQPLIGQGDIPNVNVPVFYQGAQGDFGVTPSIGGTNGAYAKTNKPRYFATLVGGSHFEWTNILCDGQKTVDDCLANKSNTTFIVNFSATFLARYLRDEDPGILRTGAVGVASYVHDE